MLNKKNLITNASIYGYTLMEVMAVITIMGFLAVVVAPAIVNKSDQKLILRTLVSMDGIKKAILGTTSARIKGDVRFTGYVQDMGILPELIDQTGNAVQFGGQPKTLWANDDLILFRPYAGGRDFYRIGWRGPYLKPPARGMLVDGWGNPFVFKRDAGDFIITSRGGDNKPGGTGFDRDITCRIKERDYSATVAGYVSPQAIMQPDQVVEVRLYYTPETDCQPETIDVYKSRYNILDCVGFMETSAEPDGYFHFSHVPIGTQRLLQVENKTADLRWGYKLAVEPESLWLGTLGLAH